MKEHWQQILADGYNNPHELAKDLELSRLINLDAHQLFRTRVPKPFVAKMEKGNLQDPLLMQVLPVNKEFRQVLSYSTDPLGEQLANHLPGLLHKYQSRVLLTFRTACAINCRYCFRRHFPYQENTINKKQLSEIITYLNSHPEINEVILSGGDPLMAKDGAIKNIIQALEAIPHIKRLRIHSRLPVVIPERLTIKLRDLLHETRLQSLIVLHINHPNEIDDNLKHYLLPFRDSKVQLLNQSVLLKGINDSSVTLVRLSEALFALGILPYYLFLLDKVSGAAHFAVSEGKAKQLLAEITTLLPGYLVPKLAKEKTGEKSKTLL